MYLQIKTKSISFIVGGVLGILTTLFFTWVLYIGARALVPHWVPTVAFEMAAKRACLLSLNGRSRYGSVLIDKKLKDSYAFPLDKGVLIVFTQSMAFKNAFGMPSRVAGACKYNVSTKESEVFFIGTPT